MNLRHKRFKTLFLLSSLCPYSSARIECDLAVKELLAREKVETEVQILVRALNLKVHIYAVLHDP